MKAICVNEFGGPEVLRLSDVASPAVASGQILIRAGAAGVNPVETYIRSGHYARLPALPYTPGTDAAGVVEAVGTEVTSFAQGDRVYVAGSISGTYCELILCHEHQVYSLPDHVTFAGGAALGTPYVTALYALMYRAQAKEGDVVLVHGATGGVGLAAVQLAASRGMIVIATGGTDEGRELLREQGVKYVFDHTAEDYREELLSVNCGRGPDVILEMLANVNLSHDLGMIAPHGRIAVIGSRGEVTINPRDAMRKEAAVLGVMMFDASAELINHLHAEIVRGLNDNTLSPVVGCEMPLGEAAAAHIQIMERGALGKIVLVP